MTRLNYRQLAEVVEFDATRRSGDRTRKTMRYNYLVPDGVDVEIVNVAIKPNKAGTPMAKEVVWIKPEAAKAEMGDIDCLPCAGWQVDWCGEDKKKSGGRFVVAKQKLKKPWTLDIIHGRNGVNLTYCETVNPAALKDTRYRYCQYSDGSPGPGLVDWLRLYLREPRIEHLAKAQLFALINPSGIKALKSKGVMEWVRKNAESVKSGRWDTRELLYAARHGVSLREARGYFIDVHNLAYGLDSARYHLKWVMKQEQGHSLWPRLDYTRLAKAIKKWEIDVNEYGRYLQYCAEVGLDLKNEGTLYPPVKGGRKAFMDRLERLEHEYARLERIRERAEEKRRKAAAKAEKEWIAKTMKTRIKELEAFQKSVERSSTIKGCGYAIVLAKSQKELLTEGKKMGNCVGRGTYGRAIVKGDSLIVMLKNHSASYCDIEIDRQTWGVRQCYLKQNQPAPREVWELAAEIAAFLKKEHRQHRKLGMFKELWRKAA